MRRRYGYYPFCRCYWFGHPPWPEYPASPWVPPRMSREEEIQMLEDQARVIERKMEPIRSRIEQLRKEEQGKKS